MIRCLLPILSCLVVSAGCTKHLGPDHGTAYVNAFVKQGQDKSAPAIAPLDAEDAEHIVDTHHDPSQKKGAASKSKHLALPVLQ